MSAGEFPLTFLLQVQNQMGPGLNQASTQLQTYGTNAQTAATNTQTLSTNMKEASTQTSNVAVRTRSAGETFAGLAIGIGAAAAGVLNLIRQYTGLHAAQVRVASLAVREKTANIALTTAKNNLAKAIDKYGKNSKEAKLAQEKLTKAQDAAKVATDRYKLSQTQLSERIADFYISIVPSVISVVAGLVQTFDILKTRTGGVGGGGGLIGAFGKFSLVLVGIGAVALAIKTNFLGFRDALNAAGVALGNALPFLKPWLEALKNVGIVIGLLPGDADKARKALGDFANGIISWTKQVGATFGSIWDKLKKGDIKGALGVIADSLKKGFNTIVKPIIQQAWDNVIKPTLESWGIKGVPNFDTLVTAIKNGLQIVWDKTNQFVLKLTTGPENPLQKIRDAFHQFSIGKFSEGAALVVDAVVSVNATIKEVTGIDIAAWFKAHPLTGSIPLFAGITLMVDDPVFRDSVVKGGQLIITALGNAMKAAAPILTKFSRDIIDPFLASIIDNMVNFMTIAVPDWIKSTFTAANLIKGLNAVAGLGKQFIDGFVALISNPSDLSAAIGTFGTNLNAAIGGWFDVNLPKSSEKLKTIGKNIASFIWQGIIEGLKSPQQGFGGFTTGGGGFDIGKAITDFFNQFLPKTAEGGKGKSSGGVGFGLSGGTGVGGGFTTGLSTDIQKSISAYNTLARVIVQVTKDTQAWTNANNTLARTITQLSKNVDSLTKSDNTLARTIVTITKDAGSWSKANNTLARTLITVKKDVDALIKSDNILARGLVTVGKDASSAASKLNDVASAAKKAASAIKSIPSGGGGGGNIWDAIAGQSGIHKWINKPTLILAGEAGKERVDITPAHQMAARSILGNSGSASGGGGENTFNFNISLDGTFLGRKIIRTHGKDASVLV